MLKDEKVSYKRKLAVSQDFTRLWVHFIWTILIKSSSVPLNNCLQRQPRGQQLSCDVAMHFIHGFLIKAPLVDDFPFESKWPSQPADNMTGASPAQAPVQIGVTCRCPNVPVASEDDPTVTLNYRAEYLQPGGWRSAEGPVCPYFAATEEKRGALWESVKAAMFREVGTV